MRLVRSWHWLRHQPAFRRHPAAVLARLAVWRARCLAGGEAEVELRESRTRLRLPAKWCGVAKLIYAFRDDYEPELAFLRQYLRPGMVMVDAGACYGIYTLVAASRVGPGGRVMAFEPASASFERLAENIRRNGFANVHLFRTALWDRPGNGLLKHAADPGRNSLGKIAGASPTSELVRLQRLDDILDEQRIARVDVIKLDVEGAEEAVLLGAMRTLKVRRPLIILEENSQAAAALGLQASGAVNLLRSLGYQLYRAGPQGALRAGAGGMGGNLVALAGETP